MYNTDEVQPDPTSWDVVFDPAKAGEYRGKVTAYDNPIYIADAALYLSEHNPDLGITDPYELDDEQFHAAIDLLKEQSENVGEYWSDAAKKIQRSRRRHGRRDDLAVPGEPAQARARSKTTLPEEGATGWSDTWMISSEDEHPNCAYDGSTTSSSPEANAAAGLVRRGTVEREGVVTRSRTSGRVRRGSEPLRHLPRGRQPYFDEIDYWTTPSRTAVTIAVTAARPTTSGSRHGTR